MFISAIIITFYIIWPNLSDKIFSTKKDPVGTSINKLASQKRPLVSFSLYVYTTSNINLFSIYFYLFSGLLGTVFVLALLEDIGDEKILVGVNALRHGGRSSNLGGPLVIEGIAPLAPPFPPALALRKSQRGQSQFSRHSDPKSIISFVNSAITKIITKRFLFQTLNSKPTQQKKRFTYCFHEFFSIFYLWKL